MPLAEEILDKPQIDAVADNVAEVCADPKFDPLIDTYRGVPLAHAALHLNGA